MKVRKTKSINNYTSFTIIQYFLSVIDQKLLSDVAQKLDTNFEKVISTQNTFMESCHRLQMDESQLEGQISDILNKLIDNFEAT